MAGTEQEVENPALACACGLGRRVQQQWAQCECLALLSVAGNFYRRSANGGSFLGLDAPAIVGARHNPKGAILLATGVEMQADRDQLFEYFDRGLNEDGAFLLRPTSKGWSGDPLGYRNAQVLVNGNKPVACGRLLEVGALNGDELRRDQRGQHRVLAKAPGE